MSGHRRRTEPAPDAEEAGELSASPFPGDLDEKPATFPRSRRWPGLTTYLGAGALLAAGFAIGIQAERHLGRQSAGSPVLAGAGTQGGAPGAGAQGGRATPGRSGGPTTGTLTKVAGNTLTIHTPSGATVRVKITGSTEVSTLHSGSANDLKAGSRVVVQGATAQDGTVTAVSVSPYGSG